MPDFRTLDQVDVKGKRVLLRVDLNVPMENGKITDTTRLERIVPTIAEIADKGGKVVLLSHLGRPKGRDIKESLRPVARELSQILNRDVGFAEECVGIVAENAVAEMKGGDVLCLQNTRFHKEEEENDPMFAQALAQLGDIFVNDAFSASHRAHASTEGVAHELPAYAGRNMQAELEALGNVLNNPARPVIAIIGGAKVSTKLALLENLVARLDTMVIGGAMANTFINAQGISIGKSLAERDLIKSAQRILELADMKRCKTILPVDSVVASRFEPNAPSTVCDVKSIPENGMALDIGPATVAKAKAAIDEAATLVWNGPLGAFEIEPFDKGTLSIARHIAERTRSGRLISVAGGGDTVAALHRAQVVADFSYVSTAGGAFLEWLEGRSLPGVEALKVANSGASKSTRAINV